MKLKIVGDCSKPYDIKIVDTETGEMIEGISEVNIQLLPQGGMAAITLVDLEFDLDNVEGEIDESPTGIHRGSDSPDN